MGVKNFKEFIKESAGSGLYAMTGADVIFNRHQKTFDDIYYKGDSIKDVVSQFVADYMPGHVFNPDEISFVTFVCEDFKVNYIEMHTMGMLDRLGNFHEPDNRDESECNYWFTIKKQNRPLTEDDIRREGIDRRK